MTTGAATRRGLLVLADGAQTAFAAGAVAALAESGVGWHRGRGAGLGVQVALLGVLGEGAEGARRWRRQGELGCPLLVPRVDTVRRRMAEDGVLLVPDPWSLAGWLDGEALDEHLLPEGADVPRRLRAAGARCAGAVAELRSGVARWHELADGEAGQALPVLRAAAAFPAGWGPVGEAMWVGGVGAVAGLDLVDADTAEWDVVCGFPVPAVERPTLSPALRDTVSRRDEVWAGAAVARLEDTPGVRVIAPEPSTYRDWAARDGADLGSEWPLPGERNGGLLRGLVEYGFAVASRR